MKEEKQVIHIQTQKPKPLHCDICGKQVPIGRMMVGGPFKALCKDCDKIAVKAIKAYVRMVARNPLEWFAKRVVLEMETVSSEKREKKC